MSKKIAKNDRTSCARDDTTESCANESRGTQIQMTQQADELKQGIETVENTIDDNVEMDAEEQEILDAETYRWEWSNPDLAKVDSGVCPSDIKQAMLKDVTPELREKNYSNYAKTRSLDGYRRTLWRDWFLKRVGIKLLY